MNRIFLLLFIIISIATKGQSLSNRGKEFWVGYGHNTLFVLDNGTGPNSQELVLYLSAEQAATVTVSINGTAYSQIYNIPANSVIQTAPIPKAGPDDARLTTEGLSTKGIHITSNVPIVAYAHQYGFNSSGATMLMPVETYGLTYYSLNYTQQSNATPAYSWFYVIASENNTKLEITPTAVTEGGNASGVMFTVNLNKGEIYNVFGKATGFSGNDLTGSKVKSVVGSDGICHPIAVFSGSSRIIICGNSGDVMQQQIFPSSAWGTTYLTYPSISTNSVAQTNTNYYRIAVRDPNTIVRRNGVVMTGLINNFYYEFSSASGDFIVADKPILMSQYIPSMQNCASYSGNGDPEMFFLSPIEQSINKAAFYTTSNQNIANNYLVVIIRNTGVASLRIDGSNVFDLLIPHPRNGQFRVVVKTLTANQQHTIASDSSFNAITYGLGFVESYGYNAGTAINNLEILPAIQNTLNQTGASSAFTCPKSPFKISVRLAYRPTKILWKFSQVPKFSPNIDTTIINPLPADSTLVRARLYYLYNLPRDYFFSDTGTYYVPITITAPEIDNCNNTLDLSYPIIVKTGPKPFFNTVYTNCIGDTATMRAGNIAGFNITRWNWTYDNPGISTGNPGKNVFNFNGPHPTKLQVVADNGCTGDTTLTIVTSKPTATFGMSPPSTCMGNAVIFSDTSSFTGTLQSWYWDFGIGQLTAFNNNAVTINFPSPGTYTIKHVANSNSSCRSDTTIKTLRIFAKPIVKFGVLSGCAKNGTVAFNNSSTISDGQTIRYFWNFNDPNANLSNPDTSSVKNPAHTYTVAGNYTVKLVTTTANGCKDSTIRNIVVNPFPVAAFIMNTNAQCKTNNSFTFTNTSSITIGTLSYQWSFGDGNTSLTTNPIHTYASAGTYNVKLVVTSNIGCKDSITQTVIVNPIPVVGFNINNNAQCVNANNFAFTNTSTITAGTMTYQWNFGDGNSSTSTSPVHSYSTAGPFNVVLVTTSNNGCKDSIRKIVTVNPKPLVSFSVNSVTQCLSGNNIIFTNASSIASGTLTHQWSFGDGITSTTLSPTHTYTTSGTFTVKLISTSNNGCKDSVTQTITILTKPAVNFTISNASQCLTGNSFVFTNSSSTSLGTLSYQWHFGNGGTSSSTNPTYAYLSAGVYSVKLIATSSNGCKDSITKTVAVNPMPTVGFTINNSNQCLNGNNFTFTNTSTIPIGSLTYFWTYGNGGNSAGQNSAITYLSAGGYTVKLITTSNNGCKDSISLPVVVNPTPDVTFTVNNSSQCINGNSFTFSNTSSVTAGTISYEWSFGDGNTNNTASPNYTYSTPGTYQAKLIVTSNNGCRDSLKRTVTVFSKPTIGFTVNNANQCLKGNNFIFTNTSTILSGPLTYQWNFGDGGSSGAVNPSHIYTSSGAYVVKLIAISNNNCKDSFSIPVIVNVSPNAAFTVNAPSQCIASNNFQFTNTSSTSFGILSYQWNYGDGNGAVSTNATKIYAIAGNYLVKLITTSNNGCKDSISKIVTVNPTPVAGFNINASSQCIKGNSFILTNTSNIASSTMTYQWFFGDGNSSTATNPTYNYTSIGIYTIRLIVTSANGCIDSISRSISVNDMPVSGFNINTPTQCLKGNNFSFTNTSTISSGFVTSEWFLGDGNESITSNAVHSYTTAGNYTIKLFVTSANGCKDSTSKNVTVNPMPAVAFTINEDKQCLKNNNFLFSNNSSITTVTLTYQWSFGDGSTSTAPNGTHTYLLPGNYTVKLVATSNNGCKDSLSKTSVVYHVPVASFSINNNAQCLAANNYIFNNTSTLGTGTATNIWSFGDGSFASSINSIHTYATAGNYLVKLIVISNNGCKDSISPNITVYPMPKAAYVINNNAQCLTGNNFTFTNTSVGSGTITLFWNFDDGTFSTNTNEVHTYSTNGTYVVKLIVTSSIGCKDSISQTITVNPKPTAAFNINNASQCQFGNNFVFTNTSSISSGSILYQWSFGDGGTSTTADPNHTYTSAGTYTVKLVVTSTNGCKDSASKTVVVNPQPILSFNINNPSQCLVGNAFSFTNTSNITSGTLNYQWSFGNGSTASTPNANHTYINEGNYTVKLLAVSNNGCKDSIIQVVTVNPRPSPSFYINNTEQCTVGNSFSFTNSSSIASGTLTYQWSFGDGTFSTATNEVRTYVKAGIYTVKLVSITNNGCKDSSNQNITVNPMPLASFSINSIAQCLAGNSFSFNSTSSILTGTLNYQWNFGDGNTATGNIATHNYATEGTYSVKIIATSNNGCKDSISQPITVNPMPNAGFSVNSLSQCLKNNNFSFTNISNISKGTLTYLWNFGDGTTATVVNTTHNYSTAGPKIVRLIATSNNGCRDTGNQTISVMPMPVASFAIDNAGQCLSGNNFNFTNTSVPLLTTLSSFWTFGDIGTSNSTNATRVFSSIGSFAIKLLVTTLDGCQDSSSKSVTVHPMPVASFIIDDQQQCLKGNLFNFTSNASIASGTFTQFWKFGDLQSSSQANPNHRYTTSGNFIVKQFVTSNFGCVDSLPKTITVLANPIASFTINDDEQCLAGNNLIFTNTSTPDANYTWKFDDGTTFNSNIVFKQYKTAGTFQTSIFGTGNNGCPSDTMSKFVTVYKNPTVDAGPNIVLLENTIGTLNPTVSGNGLQFLWAPSKYLSSSNVLGPLTAPLESITYTLTATGTGGCTASDTIHVKVLKRFSIPNAFSPNGDGINDTWIIHYLNDYPGCSVAVFNRFGHPVFSSTGYATPWNGTSKGGTLPVGTYYYIINPKNGLDKLTGSVTILK